jgi:hypothetical protein
MSERFTTAKLFYNFLLSFYPQPYRREYGYEMKLLFQDLYTEEVSKKRGVNLGFWLNLIWDVFVSTLSQHKQLLQKVGPVRYLNSAFSSQNLVFFMQFIFIAAICITNGFGYRNCTFNRQQGSNGYFLQ